ncbi:ferritin family protein [Geobacter sp. SVR]|uniref:ferritin family protein n=1 Tax=Geobacter sp. SVR TaxID=2495594 RepID=UPI00143EFC1A|nr:ferritin family protein [Geobacter sp. SVR]BCS52404.1 ferritin [Geobacter sp. SVR]GCF87363.1 ferritin [Geobacter sp. SVR]
MGKEYTVQEALKLAIQAEKDSMDFYRKAASLTTNERAKKVFDLLANEEIGHIKAFFSHYQGQEFGDITSFINSPPDEMNPTYIKLIKAIDGEIIEKRALELAMIEERECVGHYTQMAQGVVDPMVRGIFERVVKETQAHYDMIESEYAHVMTMVHETDQNIYVRE